MQKSVVYIAGVLIVVAACAGTTFQEMTKPRASCDISVGPPVAGHNGDDYHDGGPGFDLATFSNDKAGVFVDLASETGHGPNIGTDTIIRFESVIGGRGNDILIGDDVDNYLEGGDGFDELRGGSGDDVLRDSDRLDIPVEQPTCKNLMDGGPGNDTIFGGVIGDTMVGGPGDDEFHASGGTDTVDGGEGSDTLIFDMERSSYRVSVQDGTTIVSRIDVREDVAWVVDVETLQFSDEQVRFRAGGAGK